MATKIQLRRDTLANWLAADPVLMDGEQVLVATDASKPNVYDSKKVGDGIHRFSELEMLGYDCLQELGSSTQFPVSQKVFTDNIHTVLAEMIPFDLGIYFSSTGEVVSYSRSKMALINIPTKDCTFVSLWHFDAVGYGISFLDEKLEWIGGVTDCTTGTDVTYNWVANSVVIPEGAKYLALHTQSNSFRIETTEQLLFNTYFEVKTIKENATAIKENATAIKENATAIKENATAIKEDLDDKHYAYRFVQNSQIAPYIKELYIHGKGIEGKVLSFAQFFNNSKNQLGFEVIDEEKNQIFYLQSAKDGYNKTFFHKGYEDEAILEIIADFSLVPQPWGGLVSTKNRQILSAAFDLDYSPTIKGISDLKEITSDLKERVPGTILLSRNLFDKSSIIEGFYIETTSGTLTGSSTAAVSPLIPVKPGTIYHIERPCLSTGCPITFEVRFVEEDGKTPIKPLTEAGVEYSSYSINRNGTVKAPDNAAYFQCTLKFGGIGVDYDKVQFEEGNVATDYVPYKKTVIAGYTNLPSDLEGLSEKVTDLENAIGEVVEKVTVGNSDKIGFFSNSFLNGYCMLGKHAINNLSMFSDYIMYNYGHSGDDLLELLKRVNDNQSWLGDVPVQEWGIRYGIIAMQDNDGALFAAASDTYYENGKKLANAIKAMGGIPILGTEHDSSNYYYNFVRLANDYGITFMDWGLTATRLFRSVFKPFWHNSHPATRTGWMWTYGIKPYLDSLPRPNKSIKLFRVRPNADTSDIQNLIYEDIISRASIFEEITCGVSGLSEDTEKYFDRLDSGKTSYKEYKDEYQTIQSKNGTVSFGEFALMEVILPYDKNGCSRLLGKIVGTGITNMYIKRINSLSNPLPSLRYVAFGIVSGTLSPGQEFEVTGGVFNNNILGTYTVEDVVNGIVVTTTTSSGKTISGTDNPTTNVEGVTLKGSYDYPSADYMKRYNKSLGEWIEVDVSDEIDFTEYLPTCMDFDKVSLLLKGTSIELSDLEFSVSGSSKKVNEGCDRVVRAKNGTSVLSKTTFNDEDTEWIGLENVGKYVPVKSTVSEQYEQLPTGITSVRHLEKGQVLSQRILVENIKDLEFSPAILQIRVIARYFPEYVDTDEKWPSSKIKRGSYDCGNLTIRMASSQSDSNSVKVKVIPVGAWWNEFIIETPYFSGNYLILEAENADIQLAKCDVLQIN